MGSKGVRIIMDAEGTVEQSSTPDGVGTGRTARTTPAAAGGGTGAVDTSVNVELGDDSFRKDGQLRANVARKIAEDAPARGSERSYNEITGKTTVTTTVGGQVVTFEEDGDTRSDEQRKSGTDSAIRAFDRAVEADSEGV